LNTSTTITVYCYPRQQTADNAANMSQCQTCYQHKPRAILKSRMYSRHNKGYNTADIKC